MNSALKNVVGVLNSNSILPKKIDITKVGSRYWVSSYDKLASEIVSESIYSGMSNSKEIATLKAFTEKIERMAFSEGWRRGLKSCQTERSDGFACLPRTYLEAEKQVRENALNEAIERYAWANWWDNDSVAFKVFNYFSHF